MILYPAIDLRGGQYVRLYQGDMARATVYGSDPTAPAREFAAAGCRWLHVVDLDGAVAGDTRNRDAIEAILAATELRVQLGGGLRDLAAIERWLEAGVHRVVLGTLAVQQPEVVREAARQYPGQIAVGLDAKAGRVAISGWQEDTAMPVVAAAARWADSGVAAIVHTDIERDGTLRGPNLAASLELARAVDVPVIASGGVGSMDDIEAVARDGPELDGVIVGRALYDGQVDAAAAVQLLNAGHA